MWIHRTLLSPWWNAVLTVAALWLCYEVVSAVHGWSVQDAAFLGGREACERIEGACWPFLADTWTLFLVGVYPEDERWRPYSCLVMMFVLCCASLSARGRLGVGQVYAVWGAAPFVLVAILHGGEWLGLTSVSTHQLGGLMLTRLLSVIGIAVALPLGVLLAHGRRSRRMSAVSSQFTIILKDTSLVAIVGLLDLVTIAKLAISNPE